MREHVWNLRSRRSFAVVARALAAVNRSGDVRVVAYSVQGNHLHMVVESDDARRLATGMKVIGVRLARGLNRLMGSRGPVLDDHYHVHVLRTRAEVRHALAYVLGNFASHARRRGENVALDEDRYASTAARPPPSPEAGLFPLAPADVVRDPCSWMLRQAARE